MAAAPPWRPHHCVVFSGNACGKGRQRPGGRRGGQGGDGTATVGRTLQRHRRPRVSRQCWPEEEAVAAVGDDPARLSQDRAEERSPSTEMSRQTARALPAGTSQAGTTLCNREWASLFQCPICFDYVLPPILQCHSGHLVCSNCRPKISCCPTCRDPLGSIRNLAMEEVANSVLFPCKYASSGCEITLTHTEKADHEEFCEFRPYSCPCPGASCKWQGSLDAVIQHLMHQHESITTLQREDVVFLATDINLPSAVDWVIMQSCFGFHFILVLKKQEKYVGHQQFFAIVQLIGTRKQAEDFAY